MKWEKTYLSPRRKSGRPNPPADPQKPSPASLRCRDPPSPDHTHNRKYRIHVFSFTAPAFYCNMGFGGRQDGTA